jgi:hypothetical protein
MWPGATPKAINARRFLSPGGAARARTVSARIGDMPGNTDTLSCQY